MSYFSRFPRVVRDLADRSGKEIELRIIGQETRLDRTIVERLSDPMIHLIRNAVDHALESPGRPVGQRKATAAGGSRSGRAMRGTGSRSGSKTTGAVWTAKRSCGKGSHWEWFPPELRPRIRASSA